MLNRILLLFLLSMLGSQSAFPARSTDSIARYAAHSVLAEGRWVKIRVPETGLYQLTDSFVQEAGFTDAAHVRVWGYGGALQPEKYPDNYLQATDDLKELPTYFADGRRLFYAVGPVNWNSRGSETRSRNFYSSYGYYFLSERTSEKETTLTDSATFVDMFYPSPNDYHSLYEVDDYAWYKGGRNLYDSQRFGENATRSYTLPAYSANGKLTLCMAFKKNFQAQVFVNDSLVGTIEPGPTHVTSSGSLIDTYSVAETHTWTLNANDILQPVNTVTIKQLSGGMTRLDFIDISSSTPRPMQSLSATDIPLPEIEGETGNQDRHADEWADMVIIIPTSRKLQEQAERLKQWHEEHDGLRINLVAANELYNEFSSGTPDGSAYRRYLKMLYDRATTPEERPRYLLLFGDGAWDNRMLLSDWKNMSPDDYLLCYESANSLNETKCYVTDDYFCFLDDEDGGKMLKGDLIDVAVGRFPVTTEDEARVLVDKMIAYGSNTDAGPWQNQLCFMGDDGNKNMHMNDAEVIIASLKEKYSGYYIQKIYWDAYKLSTSVVGNRYPEVARLIRQNIENGTLVMNYTGHGNADYLSHEFVLSKNDFETIEATRPALWITASCDIMPFDHQKVSFGEAALLKPTGGAIAFYGTARTVYAYYNQYMNRNFMRHVLATDNGRRTTIGEAALRAKNDLITTGDDLTENKYQYILLGDPALALATPVLNVKIDSIDGKDANGEFLSLAAGSRVTVVGHVEEGDDFNGQLSVTLFDGETSIVCKQNDIKQSDTAFVFRDRQNIVYKGTHTIHDGHFKFIFTVSRDISYTDAPAQLLLYALSDDKQLSGHGENTNFCLAGGSETPVEEEGPQMVCYLNSPDFQNGDNVEQHALFVAELFDQDGINASGSGIGHDLELVIDKKIAYTYYLNDLFESNDGDNSQGRVQFQLPQLSYGPHKLRFRAWDNLNNSTSAELAFNIVDPTGIHVITAQEENDSQIGQVFDTMGRQIDTNSAPRGGVYIYRMDNGEVKKIMRRRQ